MNLIDAVKSGKPFRRKGGEDWLLYTNGLQWPSHGVNRAPNSTEMFADDWEIQEPTVMITRTQFWEAVKTICSLQLTGPHVDATVLAAVLAEKLGLK